MTRPYVFGERWTVPGSPERVRDVLIDLEHYPQWWPQVVAVASLGADDAWVVCRSTLPYALDLRLHAVDRELPALEVEVGGDLHGRVRFVLEPSGAGTLLCLEQDVEVRGLLALLTPLARPLLVWNHDRMMRGCVAGLRRQLAGRGEAVPPQRR
jgi:hypothetical protein